MYNWLIMRASCSVQYRASKYSGLAPKGVDVLKDWAHTQYICGSEHTEGSQCTEEKSGTSLGNFNFKSPYQCKIQCDAQEFVHHCCMWRSLCRLASHRRVFCVAQADWKRQLYFACIYGDYIGATVKPGKQYLRFTKSYNSHWENKSLIFGLCERMRTYSHYAQNAWCSKHNGLQFEFLTKRS